MKILLLVPSLVAGGVETGTVDLSQSLAKKGHTVIVVSSGGDLVEELQRHGVRHIQLPIHKKSLFSLRCIYSLVSIIRSEAIEVVHAQSRVPAWLAFFACRITRTPFVTSCHGYYSKQFFSSVMAKGERVIAISQVIADHMHNAFGVSEDKIRLVYRGVDLAKHPFVFNKYSQKKERFLVVNIGRLTPIKGQREFIEAIAIAKRQMPGIEAWIVGSGKKHQYEAQLKELVRALQLEGNVRFLGKRHDVPEIIKMADLLVLSTKVPEAFGRVIIEAGALGTAVCASRIGGITEIIDEDKDGFLFRHDDEKDMADTIVAAAKNFSRLQSMSENLRRTVEQRFSLEQMVERTEAIYGEVVSGKKILVIKPGGLGDVILAVPTLRALRKQFPGAGISFLIKSAHKSLFAQCPYIDEVIVSDQGKRSLIGELKKRKYDISIDLKNNDATHMLAFTADIPRRLGFSRGVLRFLLTDGLPFSAVKDKEPVVQQRKLLERLGVSNFEPNLELWPSPSEGAHIEKKLADFRTAAKGKLVGFVLDASRQWPTKNWPIEHFVELSRLLAKDGVTVVLIGEECSREKAKKFSAEKNIIDLTGQTSLAELVALMKHLDLLLTPDSAALHIGAAVGTPLIAFFGPTAPHRHLPPAQSLSVLAKSHECQPCYERTCHNAQELICLKSISVREVYECVKDRLKGGRA